MSLCQSTSQDDDSMAMRLSSYQDDDRMMIVLIERHGISVGRALVNITMMTSFVIAWRCAGQHATTVFEI